eukprot:scaffold789_cov261-Pinguiococcus_pyrenoidosus.AAC.13
MEPLDSGSKLEDEAEVAALVASLPLNARGAEPWLMEAHNLLRGQALHSQTPEVSAPPNASDARALGRARIVDTSMSGAAERFGRKAG